MKTLNAFAPWLPSAPPAKKAEAPRVRRAAPDKALPHPLSLGKEGVERVIKIASERRKK